MRLTITITCKDLAEFVRVFQKYVIRNPKMYMVDWDKYWELLYNKYPNVYLGYDEDV